MLAVACVMTGSQFPAVAAQDAQPAASTAKPAYVKKNTWFALNTFDGRKIDLADYQGKPVLIMFFASYCPWCKKAAPFIEHFSETYGPKGLAVVGIDIEESSAPAAAFAQNYNITFPVLTNGTPLAMSYGARGVPFFFLLDKDHEIAQRWPGYEEEMGPVMEKAITDILPAKTDDKKAAKTAAKSADTAK